MRIGSDVALFEKRQVRKVWHQKEWWFVVEDVVLALIESSDPKQYIQKMKKRDPELSKGWVQFVRILRVKTTGGVQNMNCGNTEGVLRIIQAIPSPKAEPFKQWLARIGKERIDEINDPELAMERMKGINCSFFCSCKRTNQEKARSSGSLNFIISFYVRNDRSRQARRQCSLFNGIR